MFWLGRKSEEDKRRIAARKRLEMEEDKRVSIGRKALRDARRDGTDSRFLHFNEGLSKLLYNPENEVEAKRITESLRKEYDDLKNHVESAGSIVDNEEDFVAKLQNDTKSEFERAADKYSEKADSLKKEWQDWNKRFKHLLSKLDDPKNITNKVVFIAVLWIAFYVSIELVMSWGVFSSLKSFSGNEALFISIGLAVAGIAITLFFSLICAWTWFSYHSYLRVVSVLLCFVFLFILYKGSLAVVQYRIDINLQVQSTTSGGGSEGGNPYDALDSFEKGREGGRTDRWDPARGSNNVDRPDDIDTEQENSGSGSSSTLERSHDKETPSTKEKSPSPEQDTPSLGEDKSFDMLAWLWFVLYGTFQIIAFVLTFIRFDQYKGARKCKKQLDDAREDFEREVLALPNGKYKDLEILANSNRKFEKTVPETIQSHRAKIDRLDAKAISDANKDAEIYHRAYSKDKQSEYCPKLPEITQKNAEEYRVGIPQAEREYFKEKVQYMDQKFLPEIKKYVEALKSLLDKIAALVEDFRRSMLLHIDAWEEEAQLT